MRSRNVNKLLVSLVMFLAMFCTNLKAAASDVVNIPDDNFKKVLNDKLGRGEVLADITEGDMATISGSINSTNNNITNITGAEYLINLTYLKITPNKIRDLSPLSGLTKLTHLILNGSSISDLSPLSGLANLVALQISSSAISDLTPLSGLTNLTNLFVAKNKINDVSPLRGLMKLTSVSLFNQKITLPMIHVYSTGSANHSFDLALIDENGNSFDYISSNSYPMNSFGIYNFHNAWTKPVIIGGKTVTFSGNVSQAVWHEPEITISYSAGGGNGTMPIQTTGSYKLTVLLANGFQRRNHTFIGWSGSDGGTYSDEEEVTFAEDVTLTAQWKTITPVIGFESSVKGSTLTWTIEEEIGVKNYVIKDSSGKIITTVIADGSSSYDIELPEGITDVVIEIVDNDGSSQTYAPEDGNKQITFYDLEKGWNLIAITADNADLTELKKSSSGAIWAWNGESYTSVESAEATNAVWVYMNSAKQVKVTGTKSNATIKLSSGWNLVGPVENCHIPEKALSTYSWDSINEMYQNINKDSILQEGVGYWIFSF